MFQEMVEEFLVRVAPYVTRNKYLCKVFKAIAQAWDEAKFCSGKWESPLQCFFRVLREIWFPQEELWSEPKTDVKVGQYHWKF